MSNKDPLKEKMDERQKIIDETGDSFDRFWDTKSLPRFVLHDKEVIDIYLMDGTMLTCRLLEWGSYEILVEVNFKKSGKTIILIPKHSIKYYVVEKEA